MLLCAVFCLPTMAEDPTVGHEVTLSAPLIEAKYDELVLTVSLRHDDGQPEKLQGIRIDIDGVDADLLEVVSYETLISDDAAISNTVFYSEANRRLRLLYVNFDSALPVGEDASVAVFRVTLKVREDIREAGQMELPVTVMIRTETSNITLHSTEGFAYKPAHSHIGFPPWRKTVRRRLVPQAVPMNLWYTVRCAEEKSAARMSQFPPRATPKANGTRSGSLKLESRGRSSLSARSVGPCLTSV